MPSLILPSRFTQQPQQPAQLDLGNPLTRGAQAVINGATDSNAASGAVLRVGGAGFARTATRGGLAMAFRKNCYRASVVQPAIGTQTFVEFWYGYPSADVGAKGSVNEPTFVTGSSNNSTGIAAMIGSTRATAQTMPAFAPQWGAISTWPNFASSGETLSTGVLTLLVVVRRQTGMEFWRNGVLINTVASAPTSYPASAFVVGAFIEDVAYWSMSSDTLLAGRIVADWSPAQVQAFSANPWQLFQAPTRRLWTVPAAGGGSTTTLTPTTAAIALAGYAPTVARTASQGVTPAAGAVVLAGYAPTIGQTTTLALVPGNAALTLTGYAPSVTQSSAASINPATGSVALTGYAPTVTQAVASPSLTVAPAALLLTGFAPTVTQGVPVPVVPDGPTPQEIVYANRKARRAARRRDDDDEPQHKPAAAKPAAPALTKAAPQAPNLTGELQRIEQMELAAQLVALEAEALNSAVLQQYEQALADIAKKQQFAEEKRLLTAISQYNALIEQRRIDEEEIELLLIA